MKVIFDNIPSTIENKKEDCCVVRLKTSTWSDKRGLHIKKSLTFMRKKCAGFNVIEEDISMIGADYIIQRIINLNECEDGIYEVDVCNLSRDWETGHIDDYDYKLVPMGEI